MSYQILWSFGDIIILFSHFILIARKNEIFKPSSYLLGRGGGSLLTKRATLIVGPSPDIACPSRFAFPGDYETSTVKGYGKSKVR